MQNNSVVAYALKTDVQSIADVQSLLSRLDGKLEQTTLAELHNFNKTHEIITRNVRQARTDGLFTYADFLEKFDVRFAEYYLHALQAYVQGNATSKAWAAAFKIAQARRHSPIVTLALGVNAHVNNDIPLVLQDCNAGPHHRADYKKVNSIIRRSLDEAIDNLHESAAILNPKRKIIRLPAKICMHVLIHYWRWQAWRTFKALKAGRLDKKLLSQRVVRMASRLQRLPV